MRGCRLWWQGVEDTGGCTFHSMYRSVVSIAVHLRAREHAVAVGVDRIEGEPQVRHHRWVHLLHRLVGVRVRGKG